MSHVSFSYILPVGAIPSVIRKEENLCDWLRGWGAVQRRTRLFSAQILIPYYFQALEFT